MTAVYGKNLPDRFLHNKRKNWGLSRHKASKSHLRSSRSLSVGRWASRHLLRASKRTDRYSTASLARQFHRDKLTIKYFACPLTSTVFIMYGGCWFERSCSTCWKETNIQVVVGGSLHSKFRRGKIDKTPFYLDMRRR